MASIIWHRRGSEWVGRLTAGGPDRFSIGKVKGLRCWWKLNDHETLRVGVYDLLREAKSAAETFR